MGIELGLRVMCACFAGLLVLPGVPLAQAADPAGASKPAGAAPEKSVESIRWTSREKGSVPWAEVMRAPEKFVDHLVTLEIAPPSMTRRGTSFGSFGSLTQELAALAFRIDCDASNSVEVLTSSSITLPPDGMKLTGVWSRMDERWRAWVTNSPAAFGLRLASFAPADTNGVDSFTAFPALSPCRTQVKELKERAQNLLDAMTQFRKSTALQRYAKNFPPATAKPFQMDPEVEKLLNESAPSQDTSDLQMVRQFRELVRKLEEVTQRLAESDERTFFNDRTRVIADTIAIALDLCEGRFRGRIEAEQFRAWLVNRLVILGDLVDARSAMGSGEYPQILDATAGRTAVLLKNLGEILPESRFAREDGTAVSVSSLKGKWAVLYFKRTEGPSNWRNFYKNLTNQLATISAGELKMDFHVVPLNWNRLSPLVKQLRVQFEPQILVISPEGRLAYFNDPLRPAIPDENVLRAWILPGPSGMSRAERVLQTLGVEF